VGSKAGSKKVAGLRSASTAADANIQITPYKNGYLIKGAIIASNPELEDFATWNEQLGAWYITRRRAYEYDHHYGLSLFGK
jgi:hypothetical protein